MELSRSLMPSIPKKMKQRYLNSFRPFAEVQEELEKWFDEEALFDQGVYNGFDFIPRYNLKETNKDYVAEFEVPGVKKSQIKIEVNGNRMTVRGERKLEKEEKDERRHFAETSYGTFMRAFTLPYTIEENKVVAHYEDGMLTIKIPKTEVSSVKEIPVH